MTLIKISAFYSLFRANIPYLQRLKAVFVSVCRCVCVCVCVAPNSTMC